MANVPKEFNLWDRAERYHDEVAANEFMQRVYNEILARREIAVADGAARRAR